MTRQTFEEKVFIISVYVHICVNLIVRDVCSLVHIHLFGILKYINWKYSILMTFLTYAKKDNIPIDRASLVTFLSFTVK